jgi:hypothetical protein
MKEQEVKTQMARISKFRELEKVRDEIYAAIEAITKDQPDGPCGQGPFTGNTRESRQVQSLHFVFTPTRGGASAVEMKISGLHIEAWGLGKALESMLREKLAEITAAMEKL